jgi:hypothetical protein
MAASFRLLFKLKVEEIPDELDIRKSALLSTSPQQNNFEDFVYHFLWAHLVVVFPHEFLASVHHIVAIDYECSGVLNQILKRNYSWGSLSLLTITLPFAVLLSGLFFISSSMLMLMAMSMAVFVLLALLFLNHVGHKLLHITMKLSKHTSILPSFTEPHLLQNL